MIFVLTVVQKRFSLRRYLQKPLLRCQTAYTTALVALYIGLWFWTLWLQTMKSESHRHTFILNTVLDHCTHQYMSCMLNGGQLKKKKKRKEQTAQIEETWPVTVLTTQLHRHALIFSLQFKVSEKTCLLFRKFLEPLEDKETCLGQS